MLNEAEANMWGNEGPSKKEQELAKEIKQLKDENNTLHTKLKTNETQFQKETEKGKQILTDKAKEIEVCFY